MTITMRRVSPGVRALESYFFALLMILYFNRGVPDLRRFMADFQSLFEVEKYSLWTTLPLSLTPK